MSGAIDTAGWVLVAKIVGVHGIKGNVRLKAFTEDPLHLDQYGPLTDLVTGTTYALKPLHVQKGVVVVQLAGVTDRTTAETLKGIDLYIQEAALTAVEDDDTFYHNHLVGLQATVDGKAVGTVNHIEDHGAGALLAITCHEGASGAAGRTVLIPFNKAFVPHIDTAAGVITLDSTYFAAFLSMDTSS